MFFGGGFMWIFWLLEIVVIVTVVNTMMSGNKQRKGSQKDSSMSIMEKRYLEAKLIARSIRRKDVNLKANWPVAE